jgi:acyl-[acyl-carrier-protein]-phospholipid O-acyltransferase/long-chain-fatty-acid--[acyl-carrier-protein] ligase
MDNQFHLLKHRRFLPLFVTQFLGAFNDNLYKTALSVLVAYAVWDIGGWRPEIVVSLAAALFILPFMLFAPLAGQIADKYARNRVMQIIKATEVVIVCVAMLGVWFHSVPLLLVVLFAFGAHSAFFSPCKFSVLPQHLKDGELIAGNALVNTGTYLAILFGSILGGLLALAGTGIIIVCVLLFLVAIAGLVFSFYIPAAPPPSPDLVISFNLPLEARRIFSFARNQHNGVFTAMIGTSWFFFVGAMVLAQLPNYTKQVLGVDNVVLAFFMAVFSCGIALGGLVNDALLKSKVEATYVPFAALVLTLFACDLYFASGIYHSVSPLLGDYLVTLPSFLSHTSGWRIVIDLFMISVAGGLYVVPLKAIVQERALPEMRARIIAAGCFLDAVFILGASIIAIFMLGVGFAIEHLFLLLAAGSAGMAFYLSRLVPRHVVGKIFRRQS